MADQAHRKYFLDHQVPHLFDQLARKLLEEQPADPVAFLAEQLRAQAALGAARPSGGEVPDKQHKFVLEERDIPTQWYNLAADLPTPCAPFLHPGTKQPLKPEDLAPLFPPELISQELNATDRYIPIPKEVRDAYCLYRPSPLYRAHNLERILGTPAHIYFKYEGVGPTGSHKSNTAVPQAYYNKLAGTKRLTTETGAGQWGSALSHAGCMFGLPVEVYQVAASYLQKPNRKTYMESFGSQVFSSPSERTESGRKIRAEQPNCDGSLGIAISEAVEVAAKDPEAKYCLGSVLNHVMLHQTVIGQEAIKQMAMAGEYPDVIIACVGGGSNFAGLTFPFIGQVLRKEAPKPVRVIAVEPKACPTITRGKFAYDFGDTACLTPLMKAHTLGHGFLPGAKHSGGLRYHAMAPLVSHCVVHGLAEAVCYPQREVFEAGLQFAQAEGFIPAPESCHAVKGAIMEALKCKETGTSKVILFNMSGHGYFDMFSYEKYLSKDMPEDVPLEDSVLEKYLAELPAV
eukprot:RCo050233